MPFGPQRGPPETIPLPPSPIDTDPERSGRRTWTSISSTTTMESSDGLRIKRKEKKVVVSFPNEVSHTFRIQLKMRTLISDRLGRTKRPRNAESKITINTGCSAITSNVSGPSWRKRVFRTII